MFNIEGESKCQGFNNIWLYEIEGGDTRVIVIPIRSDLIDISAIKEEADQDNEENINVNKDMKEKAYFGEELIQKKKEWNEIKEKRKEERCIIAAEKHYKMFKIEAFLGAIL